MTNYRRILTAAVAFAAAVLSACTEPKPPGSVWVTYSTKLGDESPFSWQFTIDGSSLKTVSSAITSSVRIDSLSAGEHRLVVAGLPPLCTTGADDRSIDIPAGDTLRLSLGVVCTRLTGDIVLTVLTTGLDRDEDGYAVLVDGAPSLDLPPGPSVTRTLPKLQPGTHAISLAGIASNCSLTGGPSFQSVVSAGEPTVLNISVACASTSGTVRFTTTTSGSAALEDPSGYIVTIGTTLTAIATNGTTTNSAVKAGTFTATLSDIEPNCSAAVTSKPVTVVAGATTDLTFDVSCGAYAATTPALDVTDPAADTLNNSANAATPSFDIVGVATSYAPGFMTVTLRFNRIVGTDQVLAVIDLDLDENATTGVAPRVNFYGGAATQGIEARVIYEAGPTPIAFAQTIAGDIGLVRFIAGGDSVRVIIPFHRLMNDDGNATITTIVGPDDRPTDLAPNTGAFVSHRAGTAPPAAVTSPPAIDRGVRVALPTPNWKPPRR